MKLLWTHTDFWKSEEEVNNEKIKVNTLAAKEDLLKTGGVYYKPKEQDFYKSISYFDKLGTVICGCADPVLKNCLSFKR